MKQHEKMYNALVSVQPASISTERTFSSSGNFITKIV